MKQRLWSYKITLLLVLGTCGAFGQSVSDSVMINYSATELYLEQVLHDLEEEYGIRFSYATESMLDKKVDCQFQDTHIDEVLDYLLDDQQMEYRKMGTNYLLRKRTDFKEQAAPPYDQSLHIRGTIRMKNTNEPLSHATIAIANSSTGTYAGENGNFDLEIPARHFNDSLVVHSLGMDDKMYAIKDLDDTFLFIGLESGSYDLHEVVIVNQAKKIKVFNDLAAIGIDLSSSRYGGLITDDLTRQLQKLAGVSASDDSSAEIKIRGSQSDETLVVLDGMPIYNCSHYFGIFNSINTQYVDYVSVYKSYFPSRYGGKTGGIVELKSKEDLPLKNKTTVSLDLMTAALHAERTLGDNLSLHIAGRSTLEKISNQRFNTFGFNEAPDVITIDEFSSTEQQINTNPAFSFFDINAKLLWERNANHRISLNSFISRDDNSNGFNTTVRDRNDKELSLVSSERDVWENHCFSVNNEVNFSNDLQWYTTGYYTRYQSNGNVDIEILKPTFEGQDPKTEFEVDLKQENEIADIGIKTYINKAFEKGDFTVGLEAIHHDLHYKVSDNKDDKIKENDSFGNINAFTGLSLHPFRSTTIRLDTRTTYYSELKKIYFSPRILVNTQLNHNAVLKGAYGYYQQFVRELNYEFRGEPRRLWVFAGEHGIPVLQSHNIMLGVNLLFESFGLDIELYRKEFKGLTEFTVLNPGRGNNNNGPGNRDYELFKGGGFTQGIDVSLSTSVRNYSTNISYTLSEANERYKDIFMNEYFPSEDDRRHQLTWVNELKYKSLIFGGDWVYISGSPYYDLSKIGKNDDIRNVSPEDRVNYVDDYSRIDFHVTYGFSLLQKDVQLWGSVLNAFNTNNVKYVQTLSEEIEKGSGSSETILISNAHSLMSRTVNVGIRLRL